MIDVNTFFYKDRTTTTQEIEEFFSKVRDQAANKNFVDKAEGIIFIAEDLFFYKNNFCDLKINGWPCPLRGLPRPSLLIFRSVKGFKGAAAVAPVRVRQNTVGIEVGRATQTNTVSRTMNGARI